MDEMELVAQVLKAGRYVYAQHSHLLNKDKEAANISNGDG